MKPCIVVDSVNLNLHPVFRCPLCYAARHKHLSHISSGPFFRHENNEDWVMPYEALTTKFRQFLPEVNERLKAAGMPELHKRKVKTSMLRRSAATIQVLELKQREIDVMFQGRWSDANTFALYIEWKHYRLQSAVLACDLGGAILSEEARAGAAGVATDVALPPQEPS